MNDQKRATMYDTARALIIEWIRPDEHGRSPLDRLGKHWWRTKFTNVGYIDAIIRVYPDERPDQIGIKLRGTHSPTWSNGLHRVQARGKEPKWSWWDGYTHARHLLWFSPPGHCIVTATAPGHSYGSITYERVTSQGAVEVGATEVICEVDEWEHHELSATEQTTLDAFTAHARPTPLARVSPRTFMREVTSLQRSLGSEAQTSPERNHTND